MRKAARVLILAYQEQVVAVFEQEANDDFGPPASGSWQAAVMGSGSFKG